MSSDAAQPEPLPQENAISNTLADGRVSFADGKVSFGFSALEHPCSPPLCPVRENGETPKALDWATHQSRSETPAAATPAGSKRLHEDKSEDQVYKNPSPQPKKRPPPMPGPDSDHVRAPLRTPATDIMDLTTHKAIPLTLVARTRLRRQVIDVESRLAATQRAALRAGRKTTLTWRYDDNSSELLGLVCDGQWFGREELLALSTL